MKDVLTYVDCGCAERYFDGSKPEHFTSETAAADRFMFHHRMGTTYWGVHVGSRHVLTVKRGAWIYGTLPGQRMLSVQACAS